MTWIQDSIKRQDVTSEETELMGSGGDDMVVMRGQTSRTRDSSGQAEKSWAAKNSEVRETERPGGEASRTVANHEEKSHLRLRTPARQTQVGSQSAGLSAARKASEASSAGTPPELHARCSAGKAWWAAHSVGNDPIILSKQLYKVGDQVKNHMRTVGPVTKDLHQVSSLPSHTGTTSHLSQVALGSRQPIADHPPYRSFMTFPFSAYQTFASLYRADPSAQTPLAPTQLRHGHPLRCFASSALCPRLCICIYSTLAMPDSDVFQNVSYTSCGVVASAGILLQRKYGPLIDSHDAVFRFNSAYTQGAE
eukprot:651052-Pyramimonas_sp.AAC.1